MKFIIRYRFWWSASFAFRYVEVRTNAPRGFVFTIKVSEDIAPGSVGFSLVQVNYASKSYFEFKSWSLISCRSVIVFVVLGVFSGSNMSLVAQISFRKWLKGLVSISIVTLSRSMNIYWWELLEWVTRERPIKFRPELEYILRPFSLLLK